MLPLAQLQLVLAPRWARPLGVLFAGAWMGLVSAAAAQQPAPPLKQDGWARFRPGAWQEVRIVTETIGPQGNVIDTTTTDKTTTLMAVTAQSVKLQVEITAEVAGKRFDAAPQQFNEGCHGAPAGENVTVRELGEGTATIEDKTIPCLIREFEITDADSKQVVKLYYSLQVAPYVLRRESVTSSRQSNDETMRSRDEVIAVDLPQMVLKQMLSGALVRTVQQSPTVSTTTLTVQVSSVPGGTVTAWSKELDARGRLVRRSTTELINWGLQSDKDSNGKDYNRRRDRRTRRKDA